MECMKFWKDGKAGLGCKECPGDGACHYQQETMIDITIQDGLATGITMWGGMFLPDHIAKQADCLEAQYMEVSDWQAYQWELAEEIGLGDEQALREEWFAEQAPKLLSDVMARKDEYTRYVEESVWACRFNPEGDVPF